MIRSTYRNIMLGMLVVSFGLSFYVFRKTQDKQLEIADRQNDITRLNQEFDNAKSLDVALTELDSLTITEQTATQLDILRHLGLEQSELDFQMESRDMKTIGNTNLYIHNVRISGKMPYETALGLCDRLQNTKKIMLDGVELSASAQADTSDISLVLTGKIYGLDKTLPAADTAASAQPEMAVSDTVAAVSATQSVSPATVISTTVSVSATSTPPVKVSSPSATTVAGPGQSADKPTSSPETK
jgi:hypothetical protein